MEPERAPLEGRPRRSSHPLARASLTPAPQAQPLDLDKAPSLHCSVCTVGSEDDQAGALPPMPCAAPDAAAAGCSTSGRRGWRRWTQGWPSSTTAAVAHIVTAVIGSGEAAGGPSDRSSPLQRAQRSLWWRLLGRTAARSTPPHPGPLVPQAFWRCPTVWPCWDGEAAGAVPDPMAAAHACAACGGSRRRRCARAPPHLHRGASPLLPRCAGWRGRCCCWLQPGSRSSPRCCWQSAMASRRAAPALADWPGVWRCRGLLHAQPHGSGHATWQRCLHGMQRAVGQHTLCAPADRCRASCTGLTRAAWARCLGAGASTPVPGCSTSAWCAAGGGLQIEALWSDGGPLVPPGAPLPNAAAPLTPSQPSTAPSRPAQPPRPCRAALPRCCTAWPTP